MAVSTAFYTNYRELSVNYQTTANCANWRNMESLDSVDSLESLLSNNWHNLETTFTNGFSCLAH